MNEDKAELFREAMKKMWDSYLKLRVQQTLKKEAEEEAEQEEEERRRKLQRKNGYYGSPLYGAGSGSGDFHNDDFSTVDFA